MAITALPRFACTAHGSSTAQGHDTRTFCMQGWSLPLAWSHAQWQLPQKCRLFAPSLHSRPSNPSWLQAIVSRSHAWRRGPCHQCKAASMPASLTEVFRFFSVVSQKPVIYCCSFVTNWMPHLLTVLSTFRLHPRLTAPSHSAVTFSLLIAACVAWPSPRTAGSCHQQQVVALFTSSHCPNTYSQLTPSSSKVTPWRRL